MALALVQQDSKKASGTANAISVNLALPAPATAGNLLVIKIAYLRTAGVPSVTPPTGFTLGVSRAVTSNLAGSWIYYKIAAGGEQNITVSNVSQSGTKNFTVFIEEFSGFGNWTVDKSSTSDYTSSTSTQPGSTGTLSSNSELALTLVAQNTPTTSPAIDSGFSLATQPASPTGIAGYLFTGSNAALNPTTSWVNNAQGTAAILTFYEPGQDVPVPSALAMPFTFGAPTITTDAQPAPSVVPLPFTFGLATVTADGSPAPSPLAMPFAFPAPTITITVNADVPAALPLPFAFGSPTIVSDTALTVPAALGMPFAFPAPSVQGDTSVPVPSVVPLPFAFGVPTVTASAAPAPAALAMPFAFPAPTASGDTSVAVPAALPLAFAFPAPTILRSVGRDIDLRWSILSSVGRSIELDWIVRSGQVVVPTISDADLLDLRFIGVRRSCFRWEVLDATNRVVGECHPEGDDRAPTISNDVTRAIKRSLKGLVLPPSEQADINPLVHRLRPVMVLENGSEYPLGVFLFVDGSTEPHTFGRLLTGSLLDQCFTVDQGTETTTSFTRGTSVSTAIEQVLAPLTNVQVVVDGAAGVLGVSPVWPAGTSRLKIVNDLAGLGGMYNLYFDNSGMGRVRLVPTDLTAVVPTVRYVDGSCGQTEVVGNIIEGTTIETLNLLSAPNRYLVIDNQAQSAPIVGVYDIPEGSPNSYFHRGFRIVRVINEQGLGSTAAAVARGQAAAAQDAADYSWWSYQGVIDPRHDTYDVLTVRGQVVREQSWSVQVREGAPHSHDVRLAYPPVT